MNDCDTAGDTINIIINEPLLPQYTVSSTVALPLDSIYFDDLTPGIVSRKWDFGDGTNSTDKSPLHYYSRTGRYKVMLTVTDSSGCGGIKTTEIVVRHFALHIPNSFSPNGDSLNDVFDITGFGIKSYDLQVFNRSGEQVYSGADTGWDGRFRGTFSSEGIYLYLLRLQREDGGYELRKGWVTLLR